MSPTTPNFESLMADAEPGRPETYVLTDNPHDAGRKTMLLVPVNCLGKKRVVKVDVQSFSRLPDVARNSPWYLVRSSTKSKSWGVRVGTEHVRVSRLIVNAAPGEVVSHLNGDRLDLRRSNLRVRTYGPGAKAARGIPEKFVKRD